MDGMPERKQRFQKMAQEARHFAAESEDGPDKNTWLRIAAEGDKLADLVDDRAARRERLPGPLN